MTWWGLGKTPPKQSPKPPVQQVLLVHISVRREGRPAPILSAALALDDDTTTPAAIVDGRLVFTLAPSVRYGWHATLLLETEEGVLAQSITLAADLDLDLPPLAPRFTVSRFQVTDRRLRRADGVPWVWQGLTAFRLVELVAAGRIAEVEAFCAWAQAHDVTILRVLTMAGSHGANGVPYLFRLTPEDGRQALPTVLTIAAAHGLCTEVVCLADTAFYPDANLQRHVTEVGRIAAGCPGTVLQIANEPQHGTQRGEVADPAYLAHLRGLVPRDLPTTLGPAHGSNDSDYQWMRGGDFGTVHLDRADGEDQFTHDGKGLRWVRHIKDGLDTAEALGKYVVNDECRRDDLTPWKHTAVALICRLLGLGDTFHYGGGLQGAIPTGAELAAFEGRRRGWNAIPVTWRGRFYNTSHDGAMVRSADWRTVLKVFSSAENFEAFTLAIGSPDPQFEWADDWPTREVVLHDGGVSLWKLTR